jgi:hypothetical protein
MALNNVLRGFPMTVIAGLDPAIQSGESALPAS